MTRRKVAKDKQLTHISIRLDPLHLKHLKKLCFEMANRDQKIYTVGYLIRETLLQAYPPPKEAQLDMFTKGNI